MRFESDIVKKDKRIATFKSDDCELHVCLTPTGVLYMHEKNTPDYIMYLLDFPEHLQRKIINDDVYEDELPEIMNLFGKYIPIFMKDF